MSFDKGDVFDDMLLIHLFKCNTNCSLVLALIERPMDCNAGLKGKVYKPGTNLISFCAYNFVMFIYKLGNNRIKKFLDHKIIRIHSTTKINVTIMRSLNFDLNFEYILPHNMTITN